MTASVKGVTCPLGQWTAISVGKAKVAAVARTIGVARAVIAAAMPVTGAPEMDYVTVTEASGLSLWFEDMTSNVYVWPVSAAMIMEVVTE